MSNDDTPTGFLGRWSRRKADVREGRPLDDPPRVPDAAVAVGAPSPVQTPDPAIRPTPTLADAQQLTPESDFTDFMVRGVTPDVKNAAMKKLFTDPHFNVMDGMDVYIDDYAQPDPLPLAMLRQMTSAKTLNLFDDEAETAVGINGGDKAATEASKVVAQSVPADNPSNTEPITHDHADLRLQPDPTARPEGPEPKPV